MLSSFMMGLVCVLGGRFLMSLISFFCVLMSGCVYVFVVSSVPHMVMDPMRCLYAFE